MIINPARIIIPQSVLLDINDEFLENINGITYILECNNAKPRTPPHLLFSHIKFWRMFLREENPTYKQIEQDISQNEGIYILH